MATLAKVRILLETIRKVAFYLNDEEISELGIVLNKAVERMIKENLEEESEEKIHGRK